MHDPVILAIIFIFGACFGSFLNVLIYRLPQEGASLIKPGSHCPKCSAPIKYYDNIPILSFIILGGHCRSCTAPISFRYPLVEALAAVLAALSIFHFGFTLRGLEAVFLSLVFIAIFFIDLDHTIIPDFLTLPGIMIGIGVGFMPGAFVNWIEALIGLAVGGGVFYIVGTLGQVVFKKEAMGFGDVKLAAMMGAFLGWQNLLFILILASFLGSVVGLTILFLSGDKRNSTYVPFGPFLVAAALAAIYFGSAVIQAYLRFVRR
jgi:leader peptidase (prepilin peptidase)/N-methyltransferase